MQKLSKNKVPMSFGYRDFALAAVIMQFENGVRASFNYGMNFEADAGHGIRSDWVLKTALFLHA